MGEFQNKNSRPRGRRNRDKSGDNSKKSSRTDRNAGDNRYGRGGRKMSYEEIDEICDELKVDSIPFYNAIEFKGKTVILNREKLAEEIEEKKEMKYEEFVESDHQIKYNSEEEIEEAIEKIRSYYKENLIIFIKKNTRKRERSVESKKNILTRNKNF